MTGLESSVLDTIRYQHIVYDHAEVTVHLTKQQGSVRCLLHWLFFILICDSKKSALFFFFALFVIVLDFIWYDLGLLEQVNKTKKLA